MTFIAVVLAAAIGAVVGWFARDITTQFSEYEIKANRIYTAVVTAIVVALIGWSIGLNWALPAFVWIGAVGSVMCFIDLETHRLPNKLTMSGYPAMFVLLLLPILAGGMWENYLRAIYGGIALFVFYFLLAFIYPAGMGMGDVKLSGVLGMALGYLGWSDVIIGGLSAFFIGAIISLGVIVSRRGNRKSEVAFGPSMLLGALFAILFAATIADWYLTSMYGA